MAQTWIFQATPKQFDIDRFLLSSHREGLWRIRYYSSQIEVGDIVFLWRAKGQTPGLPGVFAKAEVTTPARNQADSSNFRSYWLDPADSIRVEARAGIRILRLGSSTLLSREDIKDDPILNDLSILKAPRGTNFRVSEAHGERLWQLLERIGTPWSHKEEINAIIAYEDKTSATDLSEKMERSVSEIRKKLASFEAFDPRSAYYSPAARASELWEK